MLDRSIAKRLLKWLKPYRAHFFLALLAMALTAATEPMFPAFLKPILDKGFVERSHFSLWWVPAGIMGIFLVRGIFTFTASYLMSWITSHILNDIRQALFTKMLQVPIQHYQNESIGNTINTVIIEARQAMEMVTNVFTTAVRDSLTLCLLLGYLLYLNWMLTLIAVALIPLISVVVVITSRRLRRLNRSYQATSAELTQIVEEAARGHQVVRIFCAQKYELNRLFEAGEKLRRDTVKMTIAGATSMPLSQLVAAAAVSAVIIIALLQSGQQQTTVGSFVAFITAMLMLLTPLKHLVEINQPLQRGLVAAEKVFQLLDESIEVNQGKTILTDVKGQLSFERVSFKYPASEAMILEDINIDIQAGETIALVGLSGSGKTSFVNLVPRFYAPNTGRILLDKTPIEELPLNHLRAQIALVGQHTVLFDDSIAANVAYGCSEDQRQIDKVEQALAAAHLLAFVKKLPEGIHTQVGDNGMRLSGGQRQRLAIARAIYKNAPILILDEATAALDTESEQAVQAALAELMQNRTTLVIAHRLSTIQNADRIIVLEQGKIVEIGKHSDLLEKNGMYAHLYHLQFAQQKG